MYKLYPEIKPNRTFTLPTDSPHSLYVEECGNETGLPVVFLHGGPGAGCEPYHRRFFNPEIYRVVLFDQRGAGRSTPHAGLEHNTTQDLLGDIEKIREHLSIEQWVVFGGSWGSTLGIAYAESFPDRVLALILRGIFLCRRHEIEWFYQRGASRIFPDYWQDFVSMIPQSERDHMVEAYHQRLTGDDEIARMAAAKAWSLWEGRCATLKPSRETRHFFSDPHNALSLARIESHYFVNDSFLAPNQLLRDAYRLANLPGIIIHGRYDVICPLENALELHRAWPKSEIVIVPEAGHAASEPGITEALVKSTQEIAHHLTRGRV